jgi:hypothetical protein
MDRLPPFADDVEPFCLTLRSQQFWATISVDLVLSFDHLFDCLVHFFSFSFFSELVTVCVVNALIKGEIEDRSVRGLVDGRSLV